MKKFLFIIISVLFIPNTVFSWGLITQCIIPRFDEKNRCFLEKLLEKGARPCVSLKVTGQTSSHTAYDAKEGLRIAFNYMIDAVRNTIIKAGREEEFADFLAVFPQQVYLAQESSKCLPATIKVLGKGYTEYTALSYSWTTNIEIHNIDDDSTQGERYQIYTHEVGHWFALADLYGGRESLALQHKPTQEFSLLPVGIKDSTSERLSIMGAIDDSPSISNCDDVDGIINAVDVWLAKNGKVSNRWEKGWKSFCPAYVEKNILYAYGQPFKTEEQRLENKKRIDALISMKKGISDWKNEYRKLDKTIDSLEAQLNNKIESGKKLNTADLLISARINYLKDRRNKVGNVYTELEDIYSKSTYTGLMQVFEDTSKITSAAKDIAPNTPWYNPKELNTFKPSEDHVRASSLVKKRKHICAYCRKEITDTKGEGEIKDEQTGYLLFFHEECPLQAKKPKNYFRTYKYTDRDSSNTLPQYTYAQLQKRAKREGLQVNFASAGDAQSNFSAVLSEGLSSSSTPKVTPKPTAKPAEKPAPKPKVKSPKKASSSAMESSSRSTARVSDKKNSGNKKANTHKSSVSQRKTVAATTPKKATPVVAQSTRVAAAEPLKKCYICGKEIKESALYSFSQSKHVHKNSDCACKAFAQHHKTDEENLARYEDFYFLNMPQDVVAAKATLRSLDISLADVRSYLSKQNTAQTAALQQMQAKNNEKRSKAALEEKCKFYVNTTQKDIDRFVQDNKKLFTNAQKKQAGGRVLNKKEKRILERYNKLKESFSLTQQCAALERK